LFSRAYAKRDEGAVLTKEELQFLEDHKDTCSRGGKFGGKITKDRFDLLHDALAYFVDAAAEIGGEEIGKDCSIEAFRKFLIEAEFSDDVLEAFDGLANNPMFQVKIAKVALDLRVASEGQLQIYQDHLDNSLAAGTNSGRVRRDASENRIRVKLQDWVNNGNLKRNRDGLLEHNGILFGRNLAEKELKMGRYKYPSVLKEAFKMLGADVGDDCPDNALSIKARAIEIRAERKVKYSLARFQQKWREAKERKDFAEKDALTGLLIDDIALEEIEMYFEQVCSDIYVDIGTK
jgi:hypothetical protein